MSFLVRLPHPSTTQASMVRLASPTSPVGLTEEMTILRRLPPPRPAPLLLLLQNPLGPRPDPASPRLLRRLLGTIPPPHVGPNDADGHHDPGQESGTRRNRTLSSGTHQLTAKLKLFLAPLLPWAEPAVISTVWAPEESLRGVKLRLPVVRRY
jgi:hypothetical protein